MLVQALARYADTYLSDQLIDPAFETKPVPLVLELSKDGRFLGWVEREETITRGKKDVKFVPAHEVPKSPVNRNSGIHPLLAYDDAKWVLGPGEKHDEFVSLLREAAEATGDEGLKACVGFYDRTEEIAKAAASFNAKVTGGILLSVSPDGPVILRPKVKDFWRGVYQRKLGKRNEKGGEGMCLISGRFGPVAPTHDPVKRVPGGQPSGVKLMSFDKNAFESYGWEKNANSPVSPNRAQAYVLALNALLASGEKSRVNHGGVAFLFWLRKAEAEFDPMAILERAEPDMVRRLLEIRAEGWRRIEPNDFYLLAVSGNGGRLVVRQWMEAPLAKVLENVAGWFEGLRVADGSGGTPAPPKMWQLLGGGVLGREEAPEGWSLDLTRRALFGQRLGLAILAAALARMRLGEQKFNVVRCGLIRLAVNDWIEREEKGAKQMGVELNEDEVHGAYLCGRLLALFDGLQYQANPNVNQTVADRYYTLASTYPQLAFPKIEDLGMKHLRKLRRDKPGAAVRIEREMDEVRGQLGVVFPGPLSLVDQGRFALGFHHQRAEGFRRAKEAKENREGEEQ